MCSFVTTIKEEIKIIIGVFFRLLSFYIHSIVETMIIDEYICAKNRGDCMLEHWKGNSTSRDDPKLIFAHLTIYTKQSTTNNTHQIWIDTTTTITLLVPIGSHFGQSDNILACLPTNPLFICSSPPKSKMPGNKLVLVTKMTWLQSSTLRIDSLWTEYQTLVRVSQAPN